MRKATIIGALLSIGLIGTIAAAGKTPPATTTPRPSEVELDSVWAEEIAADTAKNEADRKQLESAPPESPLARQIQRNIAQRGDKAESYAQRAPTNVPVLTAAADQALGNGDVARAQSRAEQAVTAATAETDPRKFAEKWPLAMNTRGQIAKAMQDYPAANAYALKVLERFPKDPNALALYHDTKGRAKAGTAPAVPAPLAAAPPPKAAPPAAPPLTAPPAPGAQAFLDRATTLIGMRDFHGALDAARRAAALDPANPDPHMQQAVAWSALKNLSEAMLAISRAIERLAEGDARQPAAYNTRALYKNKTGDYAGAVADSSAALQRDPVFADAYYQRSEARRELGERADSLADLKKAAELRPADYRDLYAVAARETAAPAASVAAAAGRGRLSGIRLAIAGVGALLVLFGGAVFFLRGSSTTRRFFARPVETPSGSRLLAGHIELQGELDRGGMGVVYRAFDRNLQRPVAVKRLSPELQDRESERARILAEARTLALFHHPNIMEVHEVVAEGEDIFIVCPLLEGRTVYAELKGLGLEPGRALEIARAVAAAIDYSHGKGVIHRDLKPSNIMLTADGRVLVMDYGIAKSNVDHSRVTKTDTLAGTPSYMAPEQAAGQVCRQSDVFALGVTAYEMLTGRLPFSINDLPRKLEQRPGRFAPPSSLRPALPAALDAVFERALAAEPSQRPRNCAELVAELEAALRQPTPPRA